MPRSLLLLLALMLTAAVPVNASEVDEEVAKKKQLAALPALEARNAELEKLLKETSERLGHERQKVNALSGKALDLEKLWQAALQRIAELEARLAALQAQVKDLEVALATEKKVAQERLADRDGKLTELEEKLRVAQSRIGELEALLASEKQRAASLETKVLELEARVAELLKQNGALQATVEATKGALDELQKRKAEADARIAEFKALIDKFKSLIDAGKLRVKIVEGRMVVELATDILFGSGSATLSRSGRDALKEVAEILASIPDRTFQIEGHTDNVPIKTAQFPSNWELAAARAITVVNTMTAGGMPAARISAASYADVKPAMSNETKEGRSANRRIEIVVVPDLSSLPGFDELNRVATTPEL